VRFLWCGGLGRFVAVFGVWGMFMFWGLSLWGWFCVWWFWLFVWVWCWWVVWVLFVMRLDFKGVLGVLCCKAFLGAFGGVGGYV